MEFMRAVDIWKYLLEECLPFLEYTQTKWYLACDA